MSVSKPTNPSPDRRPQRPYEREARVGRKEGGRGGGEGIEKVAPLFAALGDGTRLAILLTLSAAGPLSITRLGEQFDVSRQAVTKHLDVLADAGLVRSHRAGRERIWEFEPKRLSDAHQFLEQVSQQWDRSLARLKAFVEG
jgi:DNA-binding transcriptional ArsR family regulator